MRAWFIGIVALSLAFVGVTGASLADTQEEETGLAVFIGEDGEIQTKEMTRSQLDHLTECTWALETNACSTGTHSPSFGFTHGFFLPGGTTVGDFQTNLVGDSGATSQFYCSFSYVEGSAAPGTSGFTCEVQQSDWPYNEEFSHDCYAFPYSTVGVLPGGGAPGWVNQPEDSTTCFVSHF